MIVNCSSYSTNIKHLFITPQIQIPSKGLPDPEDLQGNLVSQSYIKHALKILLKYHLKIVIIYSNFTFSQVHEV